MTIRLNKVTRDLNVGIQTVVEFLQKKGFTDVVANPNVQITEQQYALLVNAFSTDKNLRIESERFIQERHNNRSKGAVAIDGYEEKKEKEKTKPEDNKAVLPEDSRQKFKPIGKIDLDNLNKKKEPATSSTAAQTQTSKPASEEQTPRKEETATPQAPKQESKPAVTPEPKAEVKQETKSEAKADKQSAPTKPAQDHKEKAERTAQPHTGKEQSPQPKQQKQQQRAATAESDKEKVNEKPASTPKPQQAPTATAKAPQAEKQEEPKPEKQEEKIFTLHKKEEFASKLNIIGQIDLATLNQSTRPKRKSKAEKRKEREEKEKLRQDQKNAMKAAIIKEIRGDVKKDDKGATTQGDGTAKKKRHRISNKEKVDITNSANFQKSDPNRNKDNKGVGGNKQQGDHKGGGGRNKDRFKKPVVKQEPSEEDVAKQVKETLARLTSKGKSKTSKYRKEKRDVVAGRMQEQEDLEMAESKTLKLTEFVTANELANMMNISVTQVIATCMSVGIMVSINQRLDAETINLVAEEFGYKTEYVSAEVAQAIVEEADAEEDLQPRAPIVTVMGHVDHGKTSLLDYIRKANVIAGEAGGITQHIGAYHVTLEDGREITFLDTPGHEAFTAMRARGAKVTDIVIIIVAADDNVMPQTKEAINHAMAAGVPIVFAINKIDKPGANPDKIKEELAGMNFLVEEWGGKYQSQDISAKQGIGVHELLEKVLLEAEMLELKANPNRKATGSIIESSLDKGRGYIATVLVSNGTLHVGDIVLAGASYGKVKAMFNERNQRIKEAGPSEPVLILGLNGAPAAGDSFHVFETEQEAREIANKREQLQREQGLRTQKMLTLDEVGRRLALGDFHELNVIVKGDVDGSVEALSDSLIKLSTEQIQVNVIHKGVGQISESDVSLAAASDAIIIGFQVRPSNAAARLAENEGVDIRKYSVIYDAIEEVKAAMEGMLAPTVKEQVTATIEVREVFNITKVGLVAGAMVKTGKVKRSDKARLIRDGIVIFTGSINALKRFKDDVKEVGVNFECGISLTGCNDIKVGDIIESYEEIEVKATL
jgi:translation initiation factor IF-2